MTALDDLVAAPADERAVDGQTVGVDAEDVEEWPDAGMERLAVERARCRTALDDRYGVAEARQAEGERRAGRTSSDDDGAVRHHAAPNHSGRAARMRV